MIRPGVAICGLFFFAAFLAACESPTANVMIDNNYSPVAATPLVIYRAFWQAVPFTTPIPPGSSSNPQNTVPASANTAYAILVPGLGTQPDGGLSSPPSFVALWSAVGFGVHLNQTLHIPVDDTTFEGNCAAGSFLSQDQADFITERVFAAEFSGLRYDPATCTTIGGP